MNFFVKLWRWVGPFFKMAAKTAIGIIVEEMKDAANQYVRDAENAPPGTDKHKYATDRLRTKYPDAGTAAINLAIELAVAILKG